MSLRDEALGALVFIEERSDANADRPVPVATLRDQYTEGGWAELAAFLHSHEWIRRDDRAVGGYFLTAQGREQVDDLRRKQKDRGRRLRHCRQDLLRWFDEQTQPDGHRYTGLDAFHGLLDGLPYTPEDALSSANYLEEQGLIKSMHASGHRHIRSHITDKGVECVVSGELIADFLAGQGPGSPGNTFHITNPTGPLNIAATTGHAAAATATQNNSPEELAVLVAAAVREAVDGGLLNLSPEAVDLLADLEHVQDDPGRARRALGVLNVMLQNSTSGALGTLLAQACAQLYESF